MRNAVKSIVVRFPAVARVGSMMRARMQEHTAAQAQRRVQQEAAARGIVTPSIEGTFASLRDRLAERSKLRRWPRKKGELHIFLPYRHQNWEEVLPAAMSTFGRVSVFEWGSHGFDRASGGWQQRKPEMNRAMLEAFHKAASEEPVDAVVGYLSGENTFPETLRQMAGAGAAIFNFSFDETLDLAPPQPDGSPSGPVALASAVDLNLVSVPGAELKYAVRGGLAIFHPEAADPRLHKPYDVPFKYDVTFVGACYGFRPFFIDRLRRLGINVEAFGRGWPEGEISTEKMVEFYSLSRINLGFGGVGHSRRLMCLKGRDFEVPMSGGLYLTQHNPELELVFDIGREIVTYTDEADCAATIRSLLADEAKAEAIREAGRQRCLRDHTYEARWTRVFEGAGILSVEAAAKRVRSA